MSDQNAPKSSPVPQIWEEIKAPRQEPHKTAWLLSFIDLTGILVGFFVLVFSTQVIDRGSWQELSGGFRSAFNPSIAVLPTTPSGQANAYEVVAVEKDVLPYLDSLLRARIQGDPLWYGMVGKQQKGAVGKEMVYDLPQAALNMEDPAVREGWKRLADIVRGWKNPVTLRVVAGEDTSLIKASGVAVNLAAAMVSNGAFQVSAEVVRGSVGAAQFVVRGE